eukprot:Protomagalhaensia_wolfi_Nauph_80__889@NODE_1511_length_1493_cov_39_845254_g1171_i0_p2_GENE_NODE_1511_length_1493_cov_39_845254_g1171_i0NODE_1511_length_1493_cov_39_845254_g1171_i0_p2_ORF_typecomplete_len135_score20_19_NODE_1511_length_1493_cov_39_845254_g1171_i0121525
MFHYTRERENAHRQPTTDRQNSFQPAGKLAERSPPGAAVPARDWIALIDFSGLRYSEETAVVIDSALESPASYQPVWRLPTSSTPELRSVTNCDVLMESFDGPELMAEAPMIELDQEGDYTEDENDIGSGSEDQ